jgi:dTDP-4-dehydrorhamnose 3,5-epimerase
MERRATPVPGVVELAFPRHADTRGSFQRTWCADSFAAAGLAFAPVQSSLSVNLATHTLRGMHWQAAPHGEGKLVRCVAGVVWDVALDLRPGPGFGRWHGVRLDADHGNALLIPAGCAHGFLTLTPGAVVEYLIDAPFVPDTARGLRWNDPAFGIDWPAAPAVISGRDADWPDWQGDHG